MTEVLEGGEWSAARPGRTLPPGKTRYQLYRMLGGPLDRSGRAENLVPTGIRSRTVQPVAQSLYRLSYRAHTFIILYYNIIGPPSCMRCVVARNVFIRRILVLVNMWCDLQTKKQISPRYVRRSRRCSVICHVSWEIPTYFGPLHVCSKGRCLLSNIITS